MLQPRVLVPFRPSVIPVLVSDASQHGVAATLFQDGRLVATWSLALSEVQTRWKVFDLEAFAMTQALQRWRHWLINTKVICVSDHKGLSALTNPDYPISNKIRRWVADLAGFDVEIRYVAGEDAMIQMADWLSRTPSATLHEAKALAATASPEVASATRLVVPKGSALVAAMRASHAERLDPPSGLPPLLSDMMSTTASKRLSGALRSSLPLRTEASAWRWWSPSSPSPPTAPPLVALEARKKWLRAAEMEERPENFPAALVNITVVALPPALLADIKQAYPTDPNFPPSESRLEHLFKDGLWLCRQNHAEGWRVMIPDAPEVKDAIFRAAHDVSMAGHRDAEETYSRVARLAWWPGLRKWISGKVAQCWRCARAKHRTVPIAGEVHAIENPSRPFEHVHIDAASGLPLARGYNQCWILICRFTRFVFFIPGHSEDPAHTVARRLYERVFSLVGLPRVVTSDGEPRINGVFFNALYSVAGVRHTTSVPRRSQANGLPERMIRTLRAYLRTSANSNKDDWPERIYDAQFVCNTSAASIHGFSPSRLLFGFEPRGPLHLTLPSVTEDASDAADWLRSRHRSQDLAFNKALEMQVQMLRYANARRRSATQFAVGDLVFVDANRLPDPSEGHLPLKLRSPYVGPLEVLEVQEFNLRLKLRPPFLGEEK